MREQRRPAPVSLPVALTVAGSDSGGGAGVQADLKTMEAVGTFGTSVVTAVTAQNTRGVDGSFVLPVEEIRAQFDAVADDFAVAAAKTGMLATAEVVECVAELAPTLDAPLVVDPVMVASSGDRLLSEAAEDAYEGLIAEATLVTPNADEAAVLTGIDVTDEASAQAAGEALLDTGVDAALVKGGHVGDGAVVDHLVTGEGATAFRHPRVRTDATHGSGCTLSAAIAAELARGHALEAAVERATDLLARAVRYHHEVGEGPGAVHHLVALRDAAARQATAEAVDNLAERLTAAADPELVPGRGMAVAGATPYADTPDEVATLDGRISRSEGRLLAPQSVTFGGGGPLAGHLLAAREDDASLRVAVTVARSDAVEAAVGGGAVVDRDADEVVVLAADADALVARVRALADR